MRLLPLLLFVLLGTLPGCLQQLSKEQPLTRSRSYQPLPAEDPLTGNMVPVHDPSLIRAPDGTYIVYDTDVPFLRGEHFIEQRCSRDLLEWHGCGYVFQTMPAWVRTRYPRVIGLWAPDISYFSGLYHLYYAVSTLGSQTSAIGLATNPTLDPKDPRYAWQDRGPMLTSSQGGDFNAIDPQVLVEPGPGGAAEHVWLNYGSYWGGIYQQELDPSTGNLMPGSERYHLAQQPRDRFGALEGAAMVKHQGWYFLFASVGLCCEIPIERDTYQQIVGRSRSVHGPFRAEDGHSLLAGGGTVLLSGDANWIGPGGGSLWQSGDEAETLVTFHALHRRENGALDLWVERVAWHDDWPVLQQLR